MKTFILSVSIIFSLIIGFIILATRLPQKNDLNYLIYELALEESAKSSNSFIKEETELDYNLSYSWSDYENSNFSITFAIPKELLTKAEEEFGYYPDEFKEFLEETSTSMTREMIKFLKDFARQEIENNPYSQYIQIVDISPDKFNLSLSAPPKLKSEVKVEFKSITEKIFKKRTSQLKKISKQLKAKSQEYFEKRGIRTRGDAVEVDYDFCVRKNRPRLKPVFERMKKSRQKLTIYQFLRVALAFIQEIKYVSLPLEENNKFILEFWVPPKVLVNNSGDCDSKAATFASIWTNLKSYPVVLIQIRRHILVGVAVPSAGETDIAIHGLRYTLCEVAGPEKIPPGLIHQYSRMHLRNRPLKYQLIKSRP
jgi:hypothetical protein